MALPAADADARRVVTKALRFEYRALAEAWALASWAGERSDACEEAATAILAALEDGGYQVVRA